MKRKRKRIRKREQEVEVDGSAKATGWRLESSKLILTVFTKVIVISSSQRFVTDGNGRLEVLQSKNQRIVLLGQPVARRLGRWLVGFWLVLFFCLPCCVVAPFVGESRQSNYSNPIYCYRNPLHHFSPKIPDVFLFACCSSWVLLLSAKC